MMLFSVRSSNIKAVGYDAEKQTLRVQFNTGATYDYFGVPQEVYDSFVSSASVGRVFHAEIKGRYECSRVG